MVIQKSPIFKKGLRWLVVAPHPDDETLGAGALIAQTSRECRFAGLVYLTDGSASHAASSGKSGRLVHIRRREARIALSRLTNTRTPPPIHLGWTDAAPARPGESAFDRSARALSALCRRLRVDALAVTALHEPHCDHEAAAQLAYAVQKSARRSLLVAEYLVWAAPPDRRNYRLFHTGPMLEGRRRHALSAHRSQLTASHGLGFRLPAARRRMPASDILYLRRST